MLICDEFRKKCHVIFRNFLIAFLKVFKLLSMCTKFQVNKQQFSTHKIYHEDNFTPTFLNRVQGQNTLVGIGLIELNETSDTLNYRSFFKYCICKNFYAYFFAYGCIEQTLMEQTIFLIWLGFAFCATVLKTL